MKKGQIGFNNLTPIFITLLLIVIIAGISYEFMSSQRDDLATCPIVGTDQFQWNSSGDVCYNTTGATVSQVGAGYNATANMEEGTSKITNKFPTIGLVIAAVVVIGLVYAGFRMKNQ